MDNCPLFWNPFQNARAFVIMQIGMEQNSNSGEEGRGISHDTDFRDAAGNAARVGVPALHDNLLFPVIIRFICLKSGWLSRFASRSSGWYR